MEKWGGSIDKHPIEKAPLPPSTARFLEVTRYMNIRIYDYPYSN